MPRTLEEIIESLGEDKTVVITALEAEKQRAIEESRKKGKETKDQITKINHLKDTLRQFEIDPDQDISEQLSSKLSASKTVSTETDKKVRTLEQQLRSLTEKMTETEKIASEKTAKYSRAKLTGVLQKHLGEKVYASDYVIKNLITDGIVRLQEDDETAVWAEGEMEMPLEKGIESFLKKNSSIVKNQQVPGSGSAKTTGTVHQDQMVRAEWEKLPAKERALFLTEKKGKLID